MRLRVLIYSILALVGACLIANNPINRTILKVGFLFGLGMAWAGFLYFFWKKKPVRIALFCIPSFCLLLLILPGGKIDASKLRQEYVDRLSALEGTKYVWGGESSNGIDCSGLPRRAYRDALLAYGLRNFNGQALRAYVEQWWFDASAEALGQGHRNYTSSLGVEDTIQKMDYTELQPGDLAVTFNGVHILAYLGNDQWIQSDPDVGQVVTLDGRKDSNGWFQMHMKTHRWKLLEP